MRHAIIPTLQYADAHAAIDFLVTAFGFTRRAVYDDGAGGVAHAQLLLDDNMVMVSTLRPGNIYGIDAPARLGGVTGSIAVSLDDPDAHYARAVAAGADIIVAIKDQDYGGRSYDARDPGGHVWTFGSYDPWAAV